MTELNELLSAGPAFLSLAPAYPDQGELSAERASQICSAIGYGRSVKSLGANGSDFSGRYVVGCDTGKTRLVKIVPRRIYPLQIIADKVCAFAASMAVPTIPALQTVDFAFNGNFGILVYPFIEGRFARSDVNDVSLVGRTIAKVHRALRHWPQADEVKANGATLHAQLEQCATELLSGRTEAPNRREMVFRAANLWLGRLEIERNAQMVHGDCNLTNFLFNPAGTAVHLLDFEESLLSWMNPWYDVATAVQRFTLVGTHDEGGRLARACIDAYLAEASVTPAADLYRVSLEAISRSILLMSLKTREGIGIPDAEWAKFERLIGVVDANKSLLDSLSDWSDK